MEATPWGQEALEEVVLDQFESSGSTDAGTATDRDSADTGNEVRIRRQVLGEACCIFEVQSQFSDQQDAVCPMPFSPVV